MKTSQLSSLCCTSKLILSSAAADPDEPICALRMVSREEILALAPPASRPSPFIPVHRRFIDQVEHDARRCAIHHPTGDWTYGRLARVAGAVAARLHEVPVERGEAVLVRTSRKPEMLAAVLGVLQAGCAYVPIDARNPVERVRHIGEASGARILLTERAMQRPGEAVHTTIFVEDAEDVASPPIAEPTPDDPAYILFTSGSTGRPKGVVIPHGAASAFIAWALDVHEPAALSHVLAATAFAFDLSVFEMFAPLAAGGSIVLADSILLAPEHPDYDAVTLINTVPSAGRALLERFRLPLTLRVMNLAGEPLPPKLADALLEAGVPAVFDLYGPTEATTYVTRARRDPGEVATIGRAIAPARVLVLDSRGQPAGIGASGEIAIAGPCLASGYVRRPEETAQRFVAASAPPVAEVRVYRTGDGARFLPDGRLVFEGRLDDQLKWHGYRIEPGEIIVALLELDGVREAHVALRPAPVGGPVLCGWIAGPADRRPSPARLRAHLMERVPEYMIPPRWVLLDALPRGDRGKLDKERLLKLDSEVTPEAPRAHATETNRAIAEAWQTELGLSEVQAGDEFFELGGHSLAAMRIVGHLWRSLGVVVPLRLLFEHSRLEDLARALDELVDAGTSVPPLEAGAAGDVAPLTLLQEQLWAEHRTAADASFLNMVSTTALRGTLDIERLQGAVDGLVLAHPLLRVTVAAADDQLYQVVSDLMRVEVEVLEARDEAAFGAAFARATAPFDLRLGPYVRVVIARRAPDLHVLWLVIHHILGDEWSLDLLLDELVRRYWGDTPVADGKPTFLDYAVW